MFLQKWFDDHAKKWEKWTCVWSKIRTESGFRQANWFNGVGIAAGTHDGNGVRVCVDVADGVVNAWHWLWYWCLGFPIDFVAIYIDTYLVSNCAKWCRWMPNGKTIFYIRIWNVSARVYFFFCCYSVVGVPFFYLFILHKICIYIVWIMVYALVIHTLYCEPLEMPHLF